MSEIRYKMVKVAELPDYRIYAQRTSGGGICYYTEVGDEMKMIVNLTYADANVVKLILDLDRMLNKKDKKSTGTRFDTLEFETKEEIRPVAKAGRIDRMGRCIKCGIVQSVGTDKPHECDFYGCPQV